MNNGPNPDEDDENAAVCDSCGETYNVDDGCGSFNGDIVCPDCMESETSY